MWLLKRHHGGTVKYFPLYYFYYILQAQQGQMEYMWAQAPQDPQIHCLSLVKGATVTNSEQFVDFCLIAQHLFQASCIFLRERATS